MQSIELAWAAGLFDGEGSSGNHTRAGMRMTVTQTSLDGDPPVVLSRFMNAVGSGVVKIECKKHGVWRWRIQKKHEVKRVFSLLLPYLSPAKIAQCLRVIETSDAYVAKPRGPQNKVFCKRGHLLSESRRTAPCGKKYCSTCLSDRNEERRKAPTE